MEIRYSTPELQKLCEQQKQMQKKLGAICAKKLRNRLEDIASVLNVSELVAGRPHPLKGDRQGQFALDLVHPLRLVFESANNPIPRHNDNSVIIFLGSRCT